ncbi:MAG: DEAD/DEAH box helicase [Planctomycetota bacterium]
MIKPGSHPSSHKVSADKPPLIDFPAPAGFSANASAPLAETFEALHLSAAMLASVSAAKFVKPTLIQAEFIPLALRGCDVMGQAQTGTGKTAAFLIPIFERLRPGASHTQALILAPTRELALQIYGEIERLGAALGFTAVALYGGASYDPQIKALSVGVDIIVGTPGRIMDHMRSHRLNLSGVKIAVLDEADRMLDLGFRKDIEYIMRHCPTERQTLLLSATIPDDIQKLARRFMQAPLKVWTSPEHLTVDSVEQYFLICERADKFQTLLKLIEVENPRLAIVFCATKIGARRLAEKLRRLGLNAQDIHGDLVQKQREKIMEQFRAGKVHLLIATDVASRGLDVLNITHIINYDIPYKTEDYVHRIGRTGRMEKSGKAFTFVTREEGSFLTEIELLINKEIKRIHFNDLTSCWWPNPSAKSLPDFHPDKHKKKRLPIAGDRRRERH